MTSKKRTPTPAAKEGAPCLKKSVAEVFAGRGARAVDPVVEGRAAVDAAVIVANAAARTVEYAAQQKEAAKEAAGLRDSTRRMATVWVHQWERTDDLTALKRAIKWLKRCYKLRQ